MELLAKDTHKFESRYLDGLVGPYPEVCLPEGVGVGMGGTAAAAGMVDMQVEVQPETDDTAAASTPVMLSQRVAGLTALRLSLPHIQTVCPPHL
jgi:hypothetical protein